jgi:hypothetical protein
VSEEREKPKPLLKIGRVWGLIAVSAVVGFVVGMAVAGKVWHLPPDWGDVPTWLLTAGAAVTAWYAVRAFSEQHREVTAIEQQVKDAQQLAAQQATLLELQGKQLDTQREQLAEQRELNERQSKVLELQAEDLRESILERKRETDRTAKRDELLDRQLEEAERREDSDRRRLVEEVTVLFNGESGDVVNKSQRPLTDITCKVMSKIDRHVLATPTECGEMAIFQDGKVFLTGTKPGSRIETLSSPGRCTFIFSDLKSEPDHVAVAWFTDDAGFRWQLDEYQHLLRSDDESEYVPTPRPSGG